MKKFIFILVSAFYLPSLHGLAQTSTGDLPSQNETTVDSLKSLLSSAKEDTNKVNILNKICAEFLYSGKYENSLFYGNEAALLSKKLDFEKGIAYSSFYLGKIFLNNGKTNEARQHLFLALKGFDNLKHKMGIAATYGDIALTYKADENYEKTIENYLNALKVHEEIGNTEGISFCLGWIGILYYNLGEYNRAIEYYYRCLKNDSLLGDSISITNTLNDLGNAYSKLGKLDSAFSFHEKSLDIRKAINDERGIASSYDNMASIYLQLGNNKKAIEYNSYSLEIFTRLGDIEHSAIALNNIAEIHLKHGNFSEALLHAKQSLEKAQIMGSKSLSKTNYQTIAKIYYKLNDYKNAYDYFNRYSETKDTLLGEESNKNIARMQTIYETDKKQKEIELLNKDKLIQEAAINKQKYIIWSVACGLLLVISFSILLYNRFNITRRQKSIIEKQKALVDEKQKEITDSITYAKRIQRAMLPHRNEIWKALPESFILYKPKDIVAGDFYWFFKNHETILIAAADCTGHGVPGAFTSMICSEKLNDAIKYSSNPGELLSVVNKGIKVSLRQAESTESTKDGMDIALCSVNIKSGIVKYAGANRPIWIIRNGQKTIEEIKATKQAIGGYTNDEQLFETHTIQLQQGDTFYISSDGYADQDGGDKGKKLMTKNFKQMLIDIQEKSMKEQKEYLENFIENWRGEKHQLDDILVIGVRV